ncbi:MAG: hypothetical protein JWN10_861 [Solirubrobacterales bacterium]|nr:hypothetical protein [Solirubrobacterales bacterium]
MRSSRQRRYSMPVICRARALSEATWTYAQIQSLIEREFGVLPAVKTIERWCLQTIKPEVAAKRQVYARDWERTRRARNRRVDRDRSPVWKRERMREMFDRGISVRAIGQVAAVWWGEELSEGAVRRALGLKVGEVVERRAA